MKEIVLGLLDDAGPVESDAGEWEALTRRACTGPPAAAASPAPRADAGSALKTTQVKPTERVFRSQPDLRQLMAEYNRSSTHSSPILASQSEATGGLAGPADFRRDRVARIRLPTIPGKILRPITHGQGRGGDT